MEQLNKADELFDCVWPFVGLALDGLTFLELLLLFLLLFLDLLVNISSVNKIFIFASFKPFWLHSDVFIVNFEQVSHIVLQFPLLTLKK